VVCYRAARTKNRYPVKIRKSRALARGRAPARAQLFFFASKEFLLKKLLPGEDFFLGWVRAGPGGGSGPAGAGARAVYSDGTSFARAAFFKLDRYDH
jgi:hypothetical protein